MGQPKMSMSVFSNISKFSNSSKYKMIQNLKIIYSYSQLSTTSLPDDICKSAQLNLSMEYILVQTTSQNKQSSLLFGTCFLQVLKSNLCYKHSFSTVGPTYTCFVYTRLYQILPDDTRFYQSIPDYTRLYQIIPDYTRLYQIIPDSTRFYQILPDSTRFYQIIPDYTRLYQMKTFL